MAKIKKPHRSKYYSPKRRAIYAQGDDIDHLELFERYNWICGICTEKINSRFRFPHVMAATVDHIIPLAQGGKHVWENVQPAHAKCNFSKGNSLPHPFDVIMPV